ncbi:MAG TPA: hypothetical protein VFV68_12660 [Agriterribacter sp.]|nr:hypothetical protein [Agriterribacter sp.]
MHQSQPIEQELKKITALLRDSSFALDMAKSQEAAYYRSQGQPAPSFLPENEGDGVLEKSVREEKIAINIAGFYALECGIGLLMEQRGGTPLTWLDKINTGQLDSTEQLVLNRFANATWKAGQPFRGLERITRDVFISPVFLPQEELQKDAGQVSAAAVKLSEAMKGMMDTSKAAQLERISQLLKDKTFAAEMAQHMEAAYYIARNEPIPLFLKPGEDTSIVRKSVKADKVATNIAGFYALECGLSYLATAQHKLPSEVLRSIVNDSIVDADKNIFERFANATWKAGQPFRGLDRITRKPFTSFDLLTPAEVEKDWVQIKAAAEKLSKSL